MPTCSWLSRGRGLYGLRPFACRGGAEGSETEAVGTDKGRAAIGACGRLRTARRLFEAVRSFLAGVYRPLGIGVHRSVYKPAMAIPVAHTAV